MKIQTKLSIIYTVIFGLILLTLVITVYHYYSKKSHNDYFEALHLRAALKVDLIDGETISPDILHLLYENNTRRYEPHVTIYTTRGKLVYADKQDTAEQSENTKLLYRIKENNSFKIWKPNNKQTYAFLIEGIKNNYIVFATGYDGAGFNRLKSLRWTLFTAYFITMIFIMLAVRLFAHQAFKPVSRMIDEVKKSNPSNLTFKLDEGNRKDELASLAITFNNLLQQIDKSVTEQQHLVYNISHELRTPLAAMITELELAQQHDIQDAEYKKIIDDTLGDARRLAKLSNSLLDLAKAGYNVSNIAMQPLRIDELILETSSKLQNSNKKYHINLVFDKETDDESKMVISGNEYLLGVAFKNLMDNACKYSFDKSCSIHFSYENNWCSIKVVDNGTPIPEVEQNDIFKPFYRGSNIGSVDGNGIGLYLTQKIITLHQGRIQLTSNASETSFIVILPQAPPISF